MPDKTIVQLGRVGDCLNVIPLAFRWSKEGHTVHWAISQEFTGLLSGCSYITPHPWAGGPQTLPQAVQWARSKFPNVVVTQAWMNPDPRRLTESFALEQWRHAGCLDDYGKYPLVFDRRNNEREQALCDKCLPKHWMDRPLVLCSTTSVSTPYPHADRLIALIRGLDCNVIDMDNVRAECFYDLLGLYEKADLMVSVDTSHCHLARASYLPLIMLQNDGWKGALPPPQTVYKTRYGAIGSDLKGIVEAAQEMLERRAESVAVVINTFNPVTDRHKRAMATHPKDSIYFKCEYHPRMKELLRKGLKAGKDVVMITNDDVTFLPDTLSRVLAHARKWNFGCSRRPRDPVHIGRECWWFRSDWLKANWDSVPDPYMRVQLPDMIVARWMRNQLGIPSTMESMNWDFPPVEIPAGLIQHEDHPSWWAKREVEESPEGLHNEEIWKTMT